MESNAISARKYIIKYGVILGIIFVIYNVFLYLTNNITSKHWIHVTINIAIPFCIIIYGLYSYKSNNNDFLKLGKALKIGLGISLIGGIITIVWNVLLSNVIEPNLFNQILDTQREKMILNNPEMSPEKVNETMEFSKKFSSSYIVNTIGLFWRLLLGFIISLIGGAIMHKKQNL
ncbi:DUF4199 domain-containing protein [Aquimarina sp. Aq78]|uniref:DUF4199 domain-containing protein n=1 Tax=Aquimarina sp. Aq78 TaxID=1191889 RepID=UPI000D0F74D4|nr:DUF4199 domain-containing protein [Aquimarina sp. Aq78]